MMIDMQSRDCWSSISSFCLVLEILRASCLLKLQILRYNLVVGILDLQMVKIKLGALEKAIEI